MLAHIGNIDAKLKAALVYVELARFEYGLAVLVIKRSEDYVVVQKLVEIAEQVHQFVHLIDGIGLLSHSEVRIYEREDISLFVSGEEFIYLGVAKALHAASGFGCKPALIRAEACNYALPLLLGEDILLREGFVEYLSPEGGNSSFPGRIDGIQRQLKLCSRMCERAACDFGGLAIEVL